MGLNIIPVVVKKGTAFLPVLKSNVLLHFKSHYGCT